MHSPLLFWILATLIVALALAVLLVALLRRRDPSGEPDAESASIALFRDQKRQLDDDVAAGVLAAGEREAQVAELATRLGREVDQPPQPAALPSRAPWIAALLVVAIVPLVSAGLYVALGNPAAINPPPTVAAGPNRDQVAAMVAALAQKMQANPADPRGWSLLGRSYAALGRFDDAAHAYAEASQRAPTDAGAVADWADALAMAQGQSLAGKPTELIAQALAIDPRHPKALALAGAAAMDRNDPAAALGYWRKLATVLPPESDEAKDVAAAIAQVSADPASGASALAALPPNVAAGTTAGAGATPVASASGLATAGKAPPGTAPPATAALRGRVELAPALAAGARPDEAVFIFARAVNGPRMPLAVLRTTVRDLPRDFALDDTMAMAPGMQLSAFPQVTVEARVSRSGSATPAPGDLAGQSAPVSPSAVNIRVLIDRVVP